MKILLLFFVATLLTLSNIQAETIKYRDATKGYTSLNITDYPIHCEMLLLGKPAYIKKVRVGLVGS